LSVLVGPFGCVPLALPLILPDGLSLPVGLLLADWLGPSVGVGRILLIETGGPPLVGGGSPEPAVYVITVVTHTVAPADVIKTVVSCCLIDVVRCVIVAACPMTVLGRWTVWVVVVNAVTTRLETVNKIDMRKVA